MPRPYQRRLNPWGVILLALLGSSTLTIAALFACAWHLATGAAP